MREPTPTGLGPGVHYWERQSTGFLTLAAVYLGWAAFMGILGLFGCVAELREECFPPQNPIRVVVVTNAFSALGTAAVWYKNRRVIAVTDRALHIGRSQLCVTTAGLASKAEARAFYWQILLEHSFNPLALVLMGAKSQTRTLMAPLHLRHRVLVGTALFDGKYLVGIHDPERFLAALDRLMSVQATESERRRLATIDPRYSLLDEVLEERRRAQETGQPYPD